MGRFLVLLALFCSGPAWAQGAGEMVLGGAAQIGAGTHPVRFRLVCTPSNANGTGVLGVQLEVPFYAGLRGFPFDAFEGPDADAGQLTRLEATGAGATAQGMFEASGWVGSLPCKYSSAALAADSSENSGSVCAL